MIFVERGASKRPSRCQPGGYLFVPEKDVRRRAWRKDTVIISPFVIPVIKTTHGYGPLVGVNPCDVYPGRHAKEFRDAVGETGRLSKKHASVHIK